MEARRRCIVVCPLLNDTESFVRLRAETRDAILAADGSFDVSFVVVDDSAGTDPEVSTLDPFDDVEVLAVPYNLGHQRAIVYGLRSIRAAVRAEDLVITMDSDGEDQPIDVPRLIGALDESGAALAVAQRTHRSESIGFRVMYIMFRTMFRVLAGRTVRSGNFAAQRGDSLATSIDHPSFDICYSSTLLALRRATVFVPCARGHRFAGTSRMNAHSLIAHGIRMLIPFSERIAVRLMVGASALALIALGMVTAIVTGGLDSSVGVVSVLAFVLAMFVVSAVTSVVLFAGSVQASALAMQGIVSEAAPRS